MPSADEAPPPSSGRSPWSYMGLGFELVVPPIVGVYVGYRLDLWLGTQPWMILVGALLGIGAGFLGFFREVLPPKGSGRR